MWAVAGDQLTWNLVAGGLYFDSSDLESDHLFDDIVNAFNSVPVQSGFAGQFCPVGTV